MHEIHLAGSFGVREIVEYNRTRSKIAWTFPQFFPLWEICPGLPLHIAGEAPPHKNAILLVVNLDAKTWTLVQDMLSCYGRTILLQMEAYQGWEIVYKKCGEFDHFLNFDSTYSWHEGFRPIFLPYDPELASSHLDRRGLSAALAQWRHSKPTFFALYLWRFLPRKNKAALIATLHPEARYRNRLETARRWPDWVDVYGGGWPTDLPNYRGRCVSKITTLRRYRYALVFENQRQPGYVTEKLLDCFMAGTVPIYWGAPDVTESVPEDALIVMDDDVSHIDKYMQDDTEYKKRRAALLRNRERVLRTYGKEQFLATLREAISEGTSS